MILFYLKAMHLTSCRTSPTKVGWTRVSYASTRPWAKRYTAHL